MKPFLSQPNIAVLANIATNDKQHKPIHYAAAKKAKDIVEALLPFTTGLEGKTADELLKECNFDDEVSMFPSPAPSLEAKSAEAVKAVEVPPEVNAKAETFKAAGNVAYKNKNFDDAVQQYSKAIETNPHNHVYVPRRRPIP